MPERSSSVRSSGSSRRSSGDSLRASVGLGTGDVGVDVDAAGHHDHPARVDPAGVRPDLGDDLAVLRQRSRTSPSTSLAGSWIAPPLIRIAVIVLRSLASRSGQTARPPSAPSAGSGACSVSGTPSSRWAVPAAATPAGRGADRTPRRRPALGPVATSAISVTPSAIPRGRPRCTAPRRRPRCSTSGSRRGDQLRMSAGRGRRSRHTRSARRARPGAADPGGAGQRQRHHVAAVGQLRAPARAAPAHGAARRCRRPARIRTRTRRAGRRRRARAGPELSASSRASQRQLALQRVQAGQRLDVALGRPASAAGRRARGGGVTVVDDHQRALGVQPPDARRSRAGRAAADGCSRGPRAR